MITYTDIKTAFETRLNLESGRENISLYWNNLEALKQFCIELESQIKAAGYSPKFYFSSIFRDSEANLSAGGASNSQHLYGKAVDIYFTGISQPDFIAQLRKKFSGVFISTYSDNHIHFDLRNYTIPESSNFFFDSLTALLSQLPDTSSVLPEYTSLDYTISEPQIRDTGYVPENSEAIEILIIIALLYFAMKK